MLSSSVKFWESDKAIDNIFEAESSKKLRGSASSNDSSTVKDKPSSASSAQRKRGSSMPRDRGSNDDVSSTDTLSPPRVLPMSASSNSLNKGAGMMLTKRQRLLIGNSWKRSRKTGADNVGSRIFLLVLTAQPDIKMIFGLQKIPQGRLKYDPRFRQHAVVFTKTFDYIIKNLEYPEKLAQHFQSLGKKHVTMQGRGFLPQYWETFAECMTQTAIEWEGGRRCRETMSAWRILVGFIIKNMRTGFDQENNSRKRFTSLQPPSRKPVVAVDTPRNKPPPGPVCPTSVRSTEVRPVGPAINGWGTPQNGYYLYPYNGDAQEQMLCRSGSVSLNRHDSSRSTSGYASDYGSDMSDLRQSPRRRQGRDADFLNVGYMDLPSPRQLPPRPDQRFHQGRRVSDYAVPTCPCPMASNDIKRERSPSPPYLDALESLHIDFPSQKQKHKVSLPSVHQAQQMMVPVNHMVRKYSTGVVYYH
ncbi:hypothetical protein L596_016876 [Steinernema carpocapsae]|uniref:Globin domain-containing protein n=1 Tax=Steinernema carpocapsae TaxID=34508 RepID=A0A4U5NKF4_STECR|nr:hypothetical protein L596_016876 [Steinernema carpocapsae]